MSRPLLFLAFGAGASAGSSLEDLHRAPFRGTSFGKLPRGAARTLKLDAPSTA